jgi:hypothetical protein
MQENLTMICYEFAAEQFSSENYMKMEGSPKQNRQIMKDVLRLLSKNSVIRYKNGRYTLSAS